MVQIADIKTYTSGMQKSIADKLWFMDYLDPSITNIYDFGCADGTLLRSIWKINPSLALYGYDQSIEMIGMAFGENYVATYCNKPLTKVAPHTLLNASSVFHEIHSYGSPQSIKSDYESIFNVGADYISIRDMFYSESMPLYTNPLHLRCVKRRSNYKRMQEFERIHGSMGLNKNFIHYLLKYRYVENWDREVRENYFPHSIEQFIRNLPDSYEIVYLNTYTLPFLRQKVREDFGFWIDYPTHAKILLKQK